MMSVDLSAELGGPVNLDLTIGIGDGLGNIVGLARGGKAELLVGCRGSEGKAQQGEGGS